MLRHIEESPLYYIANPRSVAFFGASNQITSMGTNLLDSLLAIGFEGPIYPVHANEERVQGLKAYKTAMALPEIPDLAVIVIPARAVLQTLDECGQRGIRHAIIISGGFKEAGAEGEALERELLEITRRYGMRFLGPNCIGVAHPRHKLNTTFMEHEGSPGFVGMASQSGSFITQMFHYLALYGMGFSTAFSVGNEADIDIVDCLEYLGACPETKVIALYIEGIRRGRRFMEMARSIVPHKPIVALYVGGSETGRKAGLSHTGAMAGPDNLYSGVFEQCGIIRAGSVTELFDFCWTLGTVPLPKGNRVVIQTHSGGPGVAAADACGRLGLELPGLSQVTRNRLAPFIPRTASINNPVDLTFSKNPMAYFQEIPDTILAEEAADMLLLYFNTPPLVVTRALRRMGIPEDQLDEQARAIIEAQCMSLANRAKGSHKPLVVYTYRDMMERGNRVLMEQGIPVFPGAERAAKALWALFQYAKLRGAASVS